MNFAFIDDNIYNRIIDNTVSKSGLEKNDVEYLYWWLLKNSPIRLISAYIAYLKCYKHIGFLAFINFTNKLSCCGITGAIAGTALRKTMQVLNCITQ